MSLEDRGHVACSCANYRARSGAARTDLRACPARCRNDWRSSMNLLPGLQSVLDELRERFGTQIESAHAACPNELYLHTKIELSGALCSLFYKRYKGRLAGVFAEDCRAEEKVYFIYYVYALDSVHSFVLVRIPINQDA